MKNSQLHSLFRSTVLHLKLSRLLRLYLEGLGAEVSGLSQLNQRVNLF